ncbi:MAG TPA: 6-bladed beta-propeller [Bacteroidales bacterium]|nr:6-bladed beta-propeller [Bacteroidales bacterium]
MRKLYLVVTVLISLLLSCKSERNPEARISNIQIDMEKASTLEGKRIVSKVEYIPIENTEESAFSEISKIQFINDKYYVLDIGGRNHHLYIYNRDGSFFQRIGNIGKGPGEYLRLCDFDVDKNEKIYLYDRQFKKIHVFDSANNHITSKPLPFRADAFSLLENDDLIFSLYNEPVPGTINPKIIVTDKDIHSISTISKYPPEFLDNRGRAGLFKRHPSGFTYNKPADDTLYIFRNDGKVEKLYHFDFGSYSMPAEYRNDAEFMMENNTNDFSYLSTTPLLVKNTLMGNIKTKNYKYFYTYNLGNQSLSCRALKETDFSHNNINFPLALIGDSIVVSYLDQSLYSIDVNKDEIPSPVVEHMNNFGIVLLLYYLK